VTASRFQPRAQPAKWNPAEYAAHSAVQQSWAREILGGLDLAGDERVLDLGCGDGKVTAEIARAVPKGFVLGTDISAEMIAFAQRTFPAAEYPNLRFQVGDAREISGMCLFAPSPPLEERGGVRRQTCSKSIPFTPALSPHGRGEGEKFQFYDVVISNAALHWVDDHEAILRGAAAVLNPGGRLVISCGGKGNAHDVFLAMRPEMRLKRWRGFFRQMPMPYFFYSPGDYENWLPKHGFKIDALKLAPRDVAYDGMEGFATWLRTTWLPYVQRVPEPLREEFIAAVAQRYLAKYPPDSSGRVHVRMVWLEIDARKMADPK
jgi:trans-aconitate methyltransferase